MNRMIIRSLTVVKPYAEALYSLASKDKAELKKWFCFLQELIKILKNEHILNHIILNPYLENFQKIELFISIIQILDQPKHSSNFIKLLIENKRILLLPEIFKQFQILQDENDGVAEVLILSAFPILKKHLENIIPLLEQKFRQKLRPRVVLDKSIIGGVCFEVKDQIFDISILEKLNQMTRLLLA
ncbi:MAG: F0F1 ATP synthase subunit delta [Bordetella sp.]|nr:MAG: F0F1 ATP synthase subunit delta [Bordetella sp.]